MAELPGYKGIFVFSPDLADGLLFLVLTQTPEARKMFGVEMNEAAFGMVSKQQRRDRKITFISGSVLIMRNKASGRGLGLSIEDFKKYTKNIPDLDVTYARPAQPFRLVARPAAKPHAQPGPDATPPRGWARGEVPKLPEGSRTPQALQERDGTLDVPAASTAPTSSRSTEVGDGPQPPQPEAGEAEESEVEAELTANSPEKWTVEDVARWLRRIHPSGKWSLRQGCYDTCHGTNSAGLPRCCLSSLSQARGQLPAESDRWQGVANSQERGAYEFHIS